MQKLTNCLWFDGRAEEAAKFYVSIFDDSRIVHTALYPEGGPGIPGTVLMVEFVLDGAPFLALNAGPQFTFTPAVSFMVHCRSQQEVDRLWGRLTEGGTEWQCGWLLDKFGVSWQIVPDAFMEMMRSPDKAAAQRGFTAMLPMRKLDLAVLRRAFDGT